MMEKVKLYHPITGGTFITTEKAFTSAWVHKGWQLADGVVPTPDVEPVHEVEDLDPPEFEPAEFD
jgi:hypothetical protein